MIVIHVVKESWRLSVSKRSLIYADEDRDFDKSSDAATTKFPEGGEIPPQLKQIFLILIDKELKS